MGRGGSYGAGFHIFKSKKCAQWWMMEDEVVVRCKYNDIVASGLQWAGEYHANVIVARKIYIMKGEVR